MGLFSKTTKTKKYDKDLSDQLLEVAPTETELVKSLLSQGADPNVHKHNKPTPLIAAATAGWVPTMEALLEGGADPDRYTTVKDHASPLEAAVYEGHIDAVQCLLDHGATINGKLFNGPPFHAAFVTKNLEMLKYLLEHGADPNKKLAGFTPARNAVLFLGCNKLTHDIRKMPKAGCDKCDNRITLIQILSLLRQYGGNPMNKCSGNGTGLIDAYVDLIADTEKWEERGAKAADFLADCTINDPMVRGMLTWMIEGGLGAIGIPTPIDVGHPMGPLAGLFGLPDLSGGKDFKKIEPKPEDRTNTAKHMGTIGRYMRELAAVENNSASA